MANEYWSINSGAGVVGFAKTQKEALADLRANQNIPQDGGWVEFHKEDENGKSLLPSDLK